jgi:alpha-N-acetylglucosamine transferase
MEQWYLRSALVMIFALTTDPQFKDPAGRDVVVLTSNMTSSEDIAELQAAGAKIHPIPHLIDGLFPDVSHTFPRYKYTFNKLWVWDLVQYDRVLFMDADMIFTRPLADVWIDPHAWPKSGLAATADLGAQLDGTYFNSGFMMVRPDRAVFEELKKVELDDVFYPDQVSVDGKREGLSY